MKNLVVLGSTGSIGTQTLDVVRANPDRFHISVLVANRSDELLKMATDPLYAAIRKLQALELGSAS